MNIQKVNKEDIKQILDIYNWYILNTTITFEIEPLTLEMFEKRIESITSKYPFYVLKEEDKVLGYGYLSYFNERAAYDITADLSLYLDHEIKSKGYGTLLLKELENWARNNNIHNIISLITEENTNSLNFHKRNGFEQCGYLKNVGIKFNKELGVYFYIKTL